MSIELLPDEWTLMREGETTNARLTQAQLERVISEAGLIGYNFTVEPVAHYWLTLSKKETKA